jgi:multidrug efflux pump subunit AcrA (membrane-fusion protein)
MRSDPAAPATPTLGTVAPGTVRQTVSATGTIKSAREANINFAVAGTVTTVRVAVGDTVRKGQRLATIDNTTLKADALSASSALTAAQTRLTADTTAAAAAVQISADNANVAAANNQLAQANRALAAAAMTSPIAGRVSAVTIAVGDTVSGSSSSGAAAQSGGGGTGGSGATATTTTGQITVISTDAFIVNASVGSADVPALKKGLQAQITPTGTNTPVFGTISSVGFVAATSTTSTATTFPVVIAVTGKPDGLLVGSSASVSIIVKQLDNVLTVPISALATVNGQTVVRQLKNGAQVDTPVTIGGTYGAQAEIVSGLVAGDQYVLPAGTAAGGGAGRVRPPGTTGGGGAGGGGFGGGGGAGRQGQGGAGAGGPGVVAP